jgi:uncharacterized protein YndB with AHSA1/START domain
MPVDDREVVSARVLAVPPERVFQAFRDPAVLARWWGPRGFTNTFQAFDLRPGGAWRFVMRGPDGAEYVSAVDFVEVAPPGRLVLDHLRPMHRFRLAMSFTAEGEGTRLEWRMRFESADEAGRVRALVLEANQQNFDRLEAELRAGP